MTLFLREANQYASRDRNPLADMGNKLNKLHCARPPYYSVIYYGEMAP